MSRNEQHKAEGDFLSLGLSQKTETAELKEIWRRDSQRNTLIFSPPDVKPGQVLRPSLDYLVISAVKILHFLDSPMVVANVTFANMLYNPRNYDSPSHGRRPKSTPNTSLTFSDFKYPPEKDSFTFVVDTNG